MLEETKEEAYIYKTCQRLLVKKTRCPHHDVVSFWEQQPPFWDAWDSCFGFKTLLLTAVDPSSKRLGASIIYEMVPYLSW